MNSGVRPEINPPHTHRTSRKMFLRRSPRSRRTGHERDEKRPGILSIEKRKRKKSVKKMGDTTIKVVAEVMLF